MADGTFAYPDGGPARDPQPQDQRTNPPDGPRPFIELEPTDHPLAVEQRTGITQDRVREIAEAVLHPSR